MTVSSLRRMAVARGQRDRVGWNHTVQFDRENTTPTVTSRLVLLSGSGAPEWLTNRRFSTAMLPARSGRKKTQAKVTHANVTATRTTVPGHEFSTAFTRGLPSHHPRNSRCKIRNSPCSTPHST